MNEPSPYASDVTPIPLSPLADQLRQRLFDLCLVDSSTASCVVCDAANELEKFVNARVAEAVAAQAQTGSPSAASADSLSSQIARQIDTEGVPLLVRGDTAKGQTPFEATVNLDIGLNPHAYEVQPVTHTDDLLVVGALDSAIGQMVRPRSMKQETEGQSVGTEEASESMSM